MQEIKNSILAGLVFGVVLGTFLTYMFGIEQGIITGSISGIIFGVAIYFFIKSDAVKKQTQLSDIGISGVIFSGGANHFKNAEAVGGKLYLLKDGLQFKSHNFNVQNHQLKISFPSITRITFFNSLGIVPNGLKVHLKDGRTEKFVVNKRKTWKEKIEVMMN